MKKQIALQGEVPVASSGKRLDQVAAELFSSYSRSMLKRWIEQELLTINGKMKKPRDRVYAGDILKLEVTVSENEDMKAEPMALDVIFEDEEIAVINKPAGLVVHPAAGNHQGTLLNGLLHKYPFLAGVPRAGIVHRLDKDTTGLMVIAKTLESHVSLVEQLQQRTVKRQYVAIATGIITAGGKVDQPVGRHPANRLKMAVIASGKPAVTHYRVIERFRTHTLLRLDLETGRTHQIRVHMHHLHHPLAGDVTYGARNLLPKGADEKLIQALRQFRRQALHAETLGLLHPASGQYMTWSAKWPEDFLELQTLLQEDTVRHENNPAP